MRNDIRYWIRPFFPKTVYAWFRYIANAAAILRKENYRTFEQLQIDDGTEVIYDFASLKHPFQFRRIPSHIDGIVQNILREEYDARLTNQEPRVIVDGGAFIGDLTCHWATKYPGARIIAVEPEAENYSYAVQNASRYGPGISVLHKALWSRSAKLSVSGAQMDAIVSEVCENSIANVEVITIPEILEMFAIEQIDLLKLDIEGAESQVLGPSSSAWLNRVGEIIVEMHGKDIERRIVAHLAASGFSAKRYRTLVHFSRGVRMVFGGVNSAK
jgi:FkbM family methyltransferase